ncbi:hypothetical protein HNP46_000256 [Pseudomonas nitritireducens]|uniref:Uncharacterized protein n=1 Tax=Pseudomonas nitroreducens TaxID=46680 RepID=A0A7W7KEM3_PSENT|nr:PapB/FocB family fimbrial expression transcriptional regulator [Pseudomonas nitritireducens]MBB4861445.1 hypothetical protein [Pseudomonas nitritireducens]
MAKRTKGEIPDEHLISHGNITPEHLNALIDRCKITKEEAKQALRRHFIDGISKAEACREAGLPNNHFWRDERQLNQLNHTVLELLPYYSASKTKDDA